MAQAFGQVTSIAEDSSNYSKTLHEGLGLTPFTILGVYISFHPSTTTTTTMTTTYTIY